MGGHLGIHLRGDGPEAGLRQQAAQLSGSAVLQGVGQGVCAAVETGAIQCPALGKELKYVEGGGEQILPGSALRVLGQAGGGALPLQALQQIAHQLLLVVEVGVEGGAVDHGPAADIGDRQLLERLFLQQLGQSLYQQLAGLALAQIQMFLVSVFHSDLSLFGMGLSYSVNLHSSR